MTLSVGVALPQVWSGRRPDAGDVRAFAARAEALGFDALWTMELTSAPVLQPLPLLAHVAAVTTRVRLGVAVLLTALRSPYALAQETATIDQLSGGRLDVGVGYGSNEALFPLHGLPSARRLSRYVQGLDVLRRLWSGDAVSHHGFWDLDGVRLEPRPVQRPHPPLLFGARRRPALARAVELGDGWIGSGSASWDEFHDSLATLRELLDEAGRERFTIGKRIYLSLAPSGRDERMREWFASNYGRAHLADSVTIVGSPAVVAERLAALVDAGLDLLLLNPIHDEPEQLEALASEVVPLVRRA
ncbi:MAG TPA: LLM class flavin-dependent oxidoreductase [Actinomycetota bacterium]|nr:LLM class flavin-dependent oxidoreductase [Actinomycetota bacterium]